MRSFIVPDLPEELHRAIEQQARSNGRTAVAEIYALLAREFGPRPQGDRVGTAIWQIARKHGVTDDDVEALELVRSKEPVQPPVFE